MKKLYFFRAVKSLFLSLTCLTPFSVHAETFSRSFSVQVFEGIYADREFNGTFSYDDRKVHELGLWTGFELTSFSFDYPDFSELIPGSFPQGEFENLFTFSVPAWNETTQSLALFYAPAPALTGNNDAFSFFEEHFLYGATARVGNTITIRGSGTITYSEAVNTSISKPRNTSIPEPGSPISLFSLMSFGAIGVAKGKMSEE